MHEDFLHYLWKYRLFSNQDKLFFNNEKIDIISPGEHNYDSGPDFFNAKIQIGDTIWAGNVELHVKSSDWRRHNHNGKEVYDNIILHVVGKNDNQVFRENGEPIPTIEITSPESIYNQYSYLMNNTEWVPCSSFVGNVDPFILLQWKEALLVERLLQKSEIVAKRYHDSGNNLEQAFYESLASNFGFKTNSLPFELLAKSLPVIILAKHKDQLQLIESLLFGQASLIPDKSTDEYAIQLRKDYEHLKMKFKLTPLNASLWKFMRMRPQNFPTLRIAQFAQLVHKSSSLFSKVLESENIDDLRELFNIYASEFWDTHYTFNSTSDKKVKILGDSSFQNIVINTIAPVLFFYGQLMEKTNFTNKALFLLEQLEAENNNIIRAWEKLGVNCENAFDSQALIQLKNVYCKHRKCLLCRIGNIVINKPNG